MKTTKTKQTFPIIKQHGLFTLVMTKKGCVKVAVGNAQVTKKEFKTMEEAMTFLNFHNFEQWELITNLLCLIVDKKTEYEKQNQKNPQ